MSTKKKRTKKEVVYERLFVYGTLMRGNPLHAWLSDTGSMLVGNAVLEGYSLISLGPYPAMVQIDAVGDHNFTVLGEVWDVPAPVFLKLKEMEESVGYQTFEDVAVNVDDDGRLGADVDVKCFVFTVIKSGEACWKQINKRQGVVEINSDL